MREMLSSPPQPSPQLASRACRAGPAGPAGPARSTGLAACSSRSSPHPTDRTDPGAHAQALRDTRPAPAPVLAGRGGGHQQHSRASPCCLAGEYGTELLPARSTDACGAVVVAEQVGDPQVVEREHILLAPERQRRLVGEV